MVDTNCTIQAEVFSELTTWYGTINYRYSFSLNLLSPNAKRIKGLLHPLVFFRPKNLENVNIRIFSFLEITQSVYTMDGGAADARGGADWINGTGIGPGLRKLGRGGRLGKEGRKLVFLSRT
ncbi:UNVERIFIED_CONTAM: hypothetical protein Sangu_2390500 [Sesamum angustifolium]|uniref:Uncharacterized protein n=1 Tax=Sesamum angustifolium TaxID=2727405 RepID=A0AAW2KZC1_9LAMI